MQRRLAILFVIAPTVCPNGLHEKPSISKLTFTCIIKPPDLFTVMLVFMYIFTKIILYFRILESEKFLVGKKDKILEWSGKIK